MARSRGDLILFLDDDAELGEERVLDRMVGEMTTPDIRRSAFKAVGGVDERLTTGEDPELFHRLRKAGYRFIVPGRAWTHHAPPADIRRFLRKCFQYGAGLSQEARLDPTRRMSLPLHGSFGWLVLLAATMLLLPSMFVDVRTQPTWRVRPGFRPLQAVARLATIYGYAREQGDDGG